MRNEYDFSKSRKNPYTKQLKRQVTIRLDIAAVDYFRRMAADMGKPLWNTEQHVYQAGYDGLMATARSLVSRSPSVDSPPDLP